METDEWCVHNRLFNANFEDKLKKKRYEIRISLTAQDTFNVTINVYNNCIFHGNNLIKIRFVLEFIFTFHFHHAKIRNANFEKVNCTSLFQNANFYYSTENGFCNSFCTECAGYCIIIALT
jgi:uncharacterized protein YjbI with pentapeptide repeats